MPRQQNAHLPSAGSKFEEMPRGQVEASVQGVCHTIVQKVWQVLIRFGLFAWIHKFIELGLANVRGKASEMGHSEELRFHLLRNGGNLI